jgi:C-terminal processing protease CtpA/Prc
MLILYSYPFTKLSNSINPYDEIYREKQVHADYVPKSFTETSRLFYLCKTWGFLKYYARQSNRYKYVDSILIASIPQTVAATDTSTYRAVLHTMIETLQPTDTLSGENPYTIADYTLINNAWMKDTLHFDTAIRQKLERIFSTHPPRDNTFIKNTSSGYLKFTNELPYSNTSDENIRLLGLFRYWNVINYFYVNKNYMDEDWDSVLYKTIPRFRKADDNRTYRREIYRLTNHLRDTHTSYPPTLDMATAGARRPNFRMLCINDTFVVNQIRLPEYPADVHVGDIVLGVDGEDVKQLYDSALVYVCGGNANSNQGFGCNAVLSRYDTVSTFTVLRGADTLTIQTRNYPVYDMFQQERTNEKEQSEKEPQYRWVNDSVAYFDLAFATRGNFDDSYRHIRSAAVLILDLRCYPDLRLALTLSDVFLPPGSFFAYASYADVRNPGMVRYLPSTTKRLGDEEYYKGRMLVLVDEDTQSYSEYLTMLLQANPNTEVVGCPTSGADGNVVTFEFPGGVRTLFSGIGLYYPDMSPTQRVGIRIDHPVERTVASVQAQRDVIYEKAVDVAIGR